jgi:hypothetical protein
VLQLPLAACFNEAFQGLALPPELVGEVRLTDSQRLGIVVLLYKGKMRLMRPTPAAYQTPQTLMIACPNGMQHSWAPGFFFESRLGTRIPAEWVYDTPLGTAHDRNKWDRYHPDILMIATEGKGCQRPTRV